MSKITIVAGQFSALMARGLTGVLGDDPDLDLIASDLDPRSLTTFVETRSPDVVLLSGQAASQNHGLIASLRSMNPQSRVIVLANDPSRSHAVRLLLHGAAACLPSTCSGDDIHNAIRAALDGQQLMVCTQPTDGHTTIEVSALTARETDVLTHLEAGLSNAEIGALLSISIPTVRSHVRHIYRKLGVRDRRDLPPRER